ncbi:MAG TPA: SdrD B-like domain-containing protein, partial [Roseiflexaceae bacterium]|nr:SdrD B-like domain-containing protein [Roseiflexaceae bacterium]
MSSESLFASLQRRVPLLAHPRQHAAPLALAGAAGLTLGAVGILLFGLPVWAAAALTLALLAFPLALKWRADRQHWGAPLALLGMLLVVQGLRTAEHLAQWAQYHLLGWPLAQAGGLVAPLNPEVVQFVWAWAVLLLATQLLRTRGRNVWMWLLLAWTALQTAELSYTFAHYLQTGVQQMPGILGRGGWLAGQADSLAPAAWLTEALPQLVATPRLDVQFWWSVGALLLLLPAAHTAARRLLSGEAPAAQADRRPALAAHAAAPLSLLRRANRRLGRAGLATAALVLAVVLSSLFQGLTPTFAAPGTVTGLVFNDFNGNGTRDTTPNNEPGVAGITVTAYDAAGTAVATATTIANGTYTLNVPVAGDPLRVEFTNLPPGYQPGPIGANSGSKVQFVTATVANVSLGILLPSEYCNNNPQLATQCYYFAAQNSVNQLKVFPYTSGTTANDNNTNIANTPAPNQQLAPTTTVGTTWGLAYARSTRQFYMASFMKRHLPFGANGPGVIYRVDRGTGTTSEFINLNTVLPGNPAGTDLHTAANTAANAGEPPYFEDYTAWDGVGKTSFAGLDLSEDEQYLWTVTLGNNNRKLYRIPVTSPSAANIQEFNLPDPGTGATGCPAHPSTQAGELNRNLRPGAVVVRGTRVYVGLTCTAESTQLRTDLRAFVYVFDTTTNTYLPLPVANFPLTYPRGAATTNGSQTINLATWEPWATAPNPNFPFGFNTTTTIPKYFLAFQQHYYPQPWLTDIAFDETGSMIVGLSDRFGHQSGNRNGNSDSGPIEGVSAGDILRLGFNGSTWDLENNATVNGVTTGGASTNPPQGPGNGEYYFHDRYTVRGTEGNQPTHNEITLGGLAVWHGSNQVVSSAFDPPPTNAQISRPNPNGPGSIFSDAFRTGGLVWFNNTGAQAGQRARSYLLYYSDEALTPQQPGFRNGTLGKAAGIGDVELLCDAAPIEIGNRVWDDVDRDGIQDPGEPALSGVTVQLYDATGTTQIATVNTDANGNYLFKTVTNATTGVQSVVLPNTTYQIRIPPSVLLEPYALTTPNADASANGDERDSDGTTVGGNSVITLTTGGPGTTNHSYDFGFYRRFSLGNRVWNDRNNDGLDNDGAGTGIDGVAVNLYRDTNGSGVLDVGDTPAGTAITAGGGYYLFTNLAAGNYLVQLPDSNFAGGGALLNFISSTGTQGSLTGPYELAPDPDNNIDGDDNGSTNSGGLTGTGLTGGIVSLPVTLGPTANEPTGDGTTPGITDQTPNAQSNLTVDFGVFQPLSLGNQVWNDQNNSGVVDGGETGIANVTVELRDASTGTLITQTQTNAQGYYLFTNLSPGSYVVVLPASNFTGPLAGFISSTGANGSPTGPYEPGNTGPADNNDNGTAGAGAISSAPITLALGTAPTGEPATPGITDPALDTNSNL